MHASLWQGIKLVFGKEFTLGLRFKAAWSTMFMFALTTLACVSLALQGAPLEPELAAALLWIILFFAAMAGADRGFADEDTAGTLLQCPNRAMGQNALYVFFARMSDVLHCAPVFAFTGG